MKAAGMVAHALEFGRESELHVPRDRVRLMRRGPAMKNRFMLAPLTNCQSHPDGRLSDEEFHWLTYRAKGFQAPESQG